ncbi:MAG TPA: NAD(+) diphosphatase [Casimicrobiaceae bacterium]|jgi:NAD+ diphosphatase
MHTPEGFVSSHTLPAPLPGTSLAFAFSDANMLICGTDATPTVPTLGDLDAAGVDGVRHYLGELSGVPCVAIGLGNPISPPSGFQLSGLRALFFRVPEPLLAIGARAFQIVEWDRTHRFCGRCGASTREKTSERAKECTVCGYVAYPRVSPAMMALVTRERELLLARAHRFPPGRYSALAGFVEPGETIEDCIRREVKEEVGIDVDGITYFASQSWAFPHSLMIAFTAEYAGGELRPDGREIAEVRWFAPDALPEMPPSVSIARRLIDATAKRLLEG